MAGAPAALPADGSVICGAINPRQVAFDAAVTDLIPIAAGLAVPDAVAAPGEGVARSTHPL
ncbi:hypothetical protein [Streptomyces sp. NPDC002553]|uniref:hypothetical protein n=1 Tax=Streptomyces sp. NPDC002553 TaxID=3154417 RepID=UPI00331973B2